MSFDFNSVELKDSIDTNTEQLKYIKVHFNVQLYNTFNDENIDLLSIFSSYIEKDEIFSYPLKITDTRIIKPIYRELQDSVNIVMETEFIGQTYDKLVQQVNKFVEHPISSDILKESPIKAYYQITFEQLNDTIYDTLVLTHDQLNYSTIASFTFINFKINKLCLCNHFIRIPHYFYHCIINNIYAPNKDLYTNILDCFHFESSKVPRDKGYNILIKLDPRIPQKYRK